MSDTIGDYYERVEQRRQEAVEKHREAVDKFFKSGKYEDFLAMQKAEEAAIDAGNTGD